jgi:hypothetical protein
MAFHHEEQTAYVPECIECHLSTRYLFESEQDAAAWWNKRENKIASAAGGERLR